MLSPAEPSENLREILQNVAKPHGVSNMRKLGHLNNFIKVMLSGWVTFMFRFFFWTKVVSFFVFQSQEDLKEMQLGHFSLFCTVRSGKLFSPLPLQCYTSPWFFLAVAANRHSCTCYCDTDRDKRTMQQPSDTVPINRTIWTLNPEISNASLLFISSLGTLHFVCAYEVKRWCWLIFTDV